VIDTLAVDWWPVTFDTARRGLGGLGPGLPWVWGFPWGFPWVWVWDGYGDYDETPWVC